MASFRAPAATFLADSPLVAQLMRDGTFQRKLTAAGAKGSAAAITFSSNGQHTAIPLKLASAYPDGQRARLSSCLVRCSMPIQKLRPPTISRTVTLLEQLPFS
jgi:hypothetical protein